MRTEYAAPRLRNTFAAYRCRTRRLVWSRANGIAFRAATTCNLTLVVSSEQCGLGADDVIRLHTETEYTVYAIGFCPGFPYLGYLPAPLCGVPRLASPRRRVEAGSVGLTGRQTGIYTEVRPGGWNLIGRTPLTLVHVADGYFPLRTGDRVRFDRIDEAEFRRLEGERL